ncbi:MAG: tetratricopeptide repeat protein [Magnetococcales bacterium]|nr:tetratricopeptide repeat protein [Magnetococcales bacterium]
MRLSIGSMMIDPDSSALPVGELLRQAVAHHHAGRLWDAERLYRLILQREPRHSESYFYLALLWQEKGRPLEEEVCYRQAVEIRPDFAEAFNNLGFLLSEQGRWEEAEVCSRRALEIRPDYVDSCVCLGNNLHRQGRNGEAELYFRRALAIDSNCFAACINLGHLQKSIHLELAELWYRQAMVIHPDSSEVYYHLGSLLLLQGRLDDAESIYLQAISLAFDHFVGHAYRDLAIIAWLRDDWGRARGIVDCLTRYNHYKDDLFFWVKDLVVHQVVPGGVKKPDSRGLEKLFIIGDSHVLSVHGNDLQGPWGLMTANAYYVRGVRMWDLAMSESNERKLYFMSLLSRLPPDSVVMFVVGEIDCRPHGGMFKTAQKRAVGRSFLACLAEIIACTVEGYLEWLSMAVAMHHFKNIVVHGINATNYTILVRKEDEEKATDYLEFLQSVNRQLEQKVLERGWYFLDAYAATRTEEGVNNRRWDLDGVHLKPEFYHQAHAWIKSPP